MPTVTAQKQRNTAYRRPVPPKKSGGGLWVVLLFAFVGILIVFSLLPANDGEAPAVTEETESREEKHYVPDWVEPELLEVDGVSRRGEKLEAVRDIALHYVGNPGTTAIANRNWFADPASETSSHFIVGLEGEVIQCIPLDEKSSATNERNRDTISVEVCHPDDSGKFSETTRRSVVRLLAWLCKEYGLTEENIIRHYDVTGKICPKYYVENEDAFLQLKQDVRSAMKEDSYGKND